MSTTFKSFLTEVAYSGVTTLDEGALETQIKSGRFSDALNSVHRLHRGTDMELGIAALQDPRKYLRKSANTINFYNFLTSDVLKNWSKFPRRNKSLICSLSSFNASGYGEIYYVFPENGSTIGVCPAQDMWNSFDNTVGKFLNYAHDTSALEFGGEFNLEFFNYRMEEVANHLGRFHLDSETGILDFIKALDSVIKGKSQKKMTPLLEAIVDYSKANGIKSGLGFFENMFNPSSNGFSMAKAGEKISGQSEVWVSATCLLIASDYYSAKDVKRIMQEK